MTEKHASLLMECAESWHVDAPSSLNEDGEPRCELHYMLDPGDGLCSTAVKDLPQDVVEMWAGSFRAAQREKALLDGLLRIEALAGRVLAGDKERSILLAGIKGALVLAQRVVAEHQAQLRADVEATASPVKP